MNSLSEEMYGMLVKPYIGVWARGGARGATPQNFYGRAKSNAKFGQNLKISEKFWYGLKKFLYFRENYVMLGEIL